MPATLTLPEAARQLGTSVRIMKHAIRSGKLPGPANLTATTALPADWLDHAQAHLEAHPKALANTLAQKVPAFARYEGTSAWRKYRVRVREFNQFHRPAAVISPVTDAPLVG